MSPLSRSSCMLQATEVQLVQCSPSESTDIKPVPYPINFETFADHHPLQACAVLDHVKNSKCTALHLYKPRCNMAYDPQDALDFYTTPSQVTPLALPRQLAVPLNLFAGQLYLSSYDDYLATCDFLGLSAEAAQDGWEIAGDGFILKDGEG